MNQNLESIQNLLQQNNQLTKQDREALLKAIANADKQWSITDFKLDRTEKVKKTTAILLEETIAELEQKRKAIEAQNRELEIEAALEKVRSCSLAMHKSDELQEVAQIVSEKLTELHVDYYTVIIIIFQEGSKDVLWWLRNVANQQYSRVLLRYSDNAYLRDLFEARENGRELFSKCYALDEKNELYQYLFKDTDLKYTPDQQKKNLLDFEFATMSVALAKNTAIHLTRYSNKSFSDKDNKILKKFARVFDQAYTRFLDLQKAEAQARESQIQLALERVRARTMAMQHSDELNEVASLLFKQVSDLGIKIWTTGFKVWSDDNNFFTDYVTNPQGGFIEPYTIDATQYPVLVEVSDAKKRGDEFFVNYEEGEQLAETYRELSKYGEKQFKAILDSGFQFPSKQYEHHVFGSKVSLLFITYEPVPEAHDIFKRFGRVFEQTYTRFLDLKKAEAQAREAQIEAALEKVRSRSMAMHHSYELEQVVASLFDRLVELDLSFDGAFIFLFEKEKRNIQLWIATIHLSAPVKIELPYDKEIENNAIIKDLWHAIENGKHLLNRSYSGETKNDYFRYVWKYNQAKIPESIRQIHIERDWTACLVAEKNSIIGFDSWSGRFTSDEDFQILLRFAKVFEQTYTRFLDLQKAEAQTREAKIEAALEKVRSRTMAMQRSEELPETSYLLFQQLTELGESGAQISIGIMNEEENTLELSTTFYGNQLRNSFKVPIEESAVLKKLFAGWKEQKKSLIIDLSGNELLEYNAFRLRVSEVKIETKADDRWIIHAAYFSKGMLSFSSVEPRPLETMQLLERFATVFDLTYTRFLDLKQAEAQARESQIQLALERVRARTMAMQKSDELQETSFLLFQQFRELGEDAEQISIGIMNEEEKVVEISATVHGNQLQQTIKVGIDEPIVMKKVYAAWTGQEKSLVIDLSGQKLRDYNAYRSKLSNVQFHTNDEDHWVINIAFFSKGTLSFSTHQPRPQETIQLLERFASVFDLTYTRFLDLQKAEAQAKESKIEAALERVRSKALAMHKTDDLNSAVAIVFEELDKLDLGVLRCGISVLNKEKRVGDVWVTSTTDQGSAVQVSGDESFDIHPLLSGAFDAWLRQEDFNYLLEGNDLKEYYKAVKAAHFQLPESQFTSAETGFKRQYMYVAAYHAGGLFAFRETEFPDEAKKVMKRFANVFDLTYKRFLDLQKAEAQTREARIELGLERVRARAMAMQNSEELNDLVAILFEELTKLDLILSRCIIWIFDKDTFAARMWMANSEDRKTADSYYIKKLDHPYYNAIVKGWNERNPEWVYDLQGDEKKSIDALLLNETELSRLPEAVKTGIRESQHTFVSGSFNNFGLIEASGPVRHSGEQLEILNRFGKVFDLSYTRFNDLKQAEASSKEAIKQAALDRIRAEIASMRTTDDLDRITPLIWNELTILGLPFIRCGVFIMDDEQRLIHTFLSTPDGKAIAAFHLPYTTGGNIPRVLENWHSRSIYTDHWDEEAFAAFANELVKQGALSSTEQYLSTLPKGGFYLHFLPFLQGMLYVGNATQLGEEEIKLIQSVADAFSTAYARYEDFNKLEAAKKQVDSTLNELQATQKQLIQSEKMASLGELTAGIAHEIQNPLNFVNNFSEVSNELLDEMKAELATGNQKLATEIAEDVKQNLEKILHHGKRADAIVKGMLQHSRTSSGQKELTDINDLADEYLRLAYHGLRAKDKSFNAKFEADLDKTIEKMNVVPQDIGRVILNLINNAFYAVTDKKHQLNGTYEPTVSISTKKLDDKVEIRVKDNGSGIPQKILDKIFQPFFTTKPTGQGTGLGLSLAYDIITKGHGGDLKVNTVENSGSEFIITLPC